MASESLYVEKAALHKAWILKKFLVKLSPIDIYYLHFRYQI